MSLLLDAIGLGRKPRTIQVVGTNGKGSTVAFIESILQRAGVATGLFTSPHLCTARERIRLNGHMISERDFVSAARHVLAKAEKLADNPSFFECILAMAMWLFDRHNIEIAILEAGLGGRLDATTAVVPDILGVSKIDLDHQHILGITRAEIATEKINAARHGQTVVTVPQEPDVEEAITGAQASIKFKLLKTTPCERPLGLFGEHQKSNASLAIALVKQLPIIISDQVIDQGLVTVNWPGRFELILGEPNILLDGAHNPSGIASLISGLNEHLILRENPLLLVYGSLAGDNALAKVELLAQSGLAIRQVMLHQPENPRALLKEELLSLFNRAGFRKDSVLPFRDWPNTLEAARAMSLTIVVCGSLYTVGAIRSKIYGIPQDTKMPSF